MVGVNSTVSTNAAVVGSSPSKHMNDCVETTFFDKENTVSTYPYELHDIYPKSQGAPALVLV